jgi:pimeloyl-ACP methyl ester carboxylesterase
MEKKVEYRNAALTYYDQGKGLPVFLLHGFAETSSVWKNQINQLNKFCRVIVPDLSGSGRSELFKLDSEYLRIDELADAVHSILKKENIGQCIMLGHSMGGYVTLAFAEKFPNKLKAFGFVHSTAFADGEEKKQNRLKGIGMIEEYGSYAFLKTSLPGLFSSAFKKKKPAVVSKLINEGKNFEAKNLQQYYYAMMHRPDRTDVLRNNKLPVLFVMGTEDNAAPLNDVLKQTHLPETAYIHIIRNSGHMSMLEEPLKLNRILKEFVHAFN